MRELHLVCGLPASGKTTFATRLARQRRAVLLDSDSVSDLIIQAAHRAAGIDPHDRDSARYKKTYREPVYETLFLLAKDNIAHTDVVIAGPFTRELELRDQWQKSLNRRFPEALVEIHVIQIEEAERQLRLRQRGALRDRSKLQ